MSSGPATSPVTDALARQISNAVLQRIADGTLNLPMMPVVATKCLALLRDPDFSFKEVAALVEQEPLMAARMLRAATSVMFAAGSKTRNLAEALSRLGAKSVKTLLIDASAHRLFISNDAKIAEVTRRIWQHSVAVALLARDISALTGGIDSETAYLAGLLHDVGKPIVASFLLDAEHQIVDIRNRSWIGSAEWLSVIKHTHRKIGVALAEKWAQPPDICKCIKECSEYDSANRGVVSNAVCFANALAKENGFAPDDSDLDDAKALVMIGRSVLGADAALINPVVAGVKQKLDRLYE